MVFERVFIVGCGDIGQRVAAQWRKRGVRVEALARSRNRMREFERRRIRPVAGDLDDVWSLLRLDLRDALVYYFAPPAEHGDNDLRMRSFVAALRRDAAPAKIVLISTSGVYGDHAGAWIDETAKLRPRTARAKRRLDAETVLRAWGCAHGVAVVVLRVAGIYGPDRLPVERLRAGTPMLREEDCPYTNRIHVDDLVTVCVAAADRGSADAVYNVADGRPGTMAEYFNAVADAIGLPRPPMVTMEQARQKLSAAMLSYLSESRRLDNRRMREELGVTLRFPDLRAGLQEIARTARG